MKNKKIFIVFTVVCMPFVLSAQTAEQLFISMPESLLLTLTKTNRMELVELYKGRLKATVENQMDDSCFLTRMTGDYLKIQEERSSLEIFILPMINDSKVVGLIRTVCAPVCDSNLSFYTVNWKPLNTNAFITPAGKERFIKESVNLDGQKVRNALIPLDISLMQFQYNPDTRELSQYYNTPQYLSIEDREKAMPYLKDKPIVFKWNQTQFK